MRTTLALLVVLIAGCGSSSADAGGGSDAGSDTCSTCDGGTGDADASEDGSTDTAPTDTAPTETSIDSGSADGDASDAAPSCVTGAACTEEGAHCTTTPPCGFPPTITCTCTSGKWSCPPACI